MPEGSPKDPEGTLSIGKYMDGEASYESYCNVDWAQISAGQQAALTAMGFHINGPYCTNPYQKMNFGFEIGFQLTSGEEEPSIDPPIVPVDPQPPVDPVDPPVDPDNPQPLPPDENLEDPEEPDNPTDDPNQPLPPDEHLKDDDNAKASTPENPDQPKTGDESQLALYLLLAAGASGTLALTVRRKRTSK